jgi:hypothetical protein
LTKGKNLINEYKTLIFFPLPTKQFYSNQTSQPNPNLFDQSNNASKQRNLQKKKLGKERNKS